ncbi:MAG: phosphonate metabolism protein PhnM [Desulfobacteraceae bacterium]|jgi:alpha-D-ribose 1-methylphosphonate 5-triphosphate diphosphatase|nr:MAG: phosphonate metabolism protein PhnM [Desulfobacteraceae bacterium]
MKDKNSENRGMIIRNARVVTPEQVLPGSSVIVEDGVIGKISSNGTRCQGLEEIDAGNRLLMPGFIDIHSDAIENAIQPRPGGRFPVDVALHELDKQLVACGVTTIYHCLCFLPPDEQPAFRNAETTDYLVRQIHDLQSGLKARTRVHARYEITNSANFDDVETLIRKKLIHFFSIMDHTPGQGQFSDVANFRAYYSKSRGLTQDQVEEMIEQRLKVGSRVDWERLAKLGRTCSENGVRMASHDDDSAGKVEKANRLGVTLSEFPVNLEAARAARRHGMLISLGSPNVLRGASLTGNLSGRDALNDGLGDILCSDYAPMSLLHAALHLHKEGLRTLPEAVRLITLHPAKGAGIDRVVGSIETGKAADLVLVDDSQKVAKICKTFVHGREVFSAGS